MRRELHPNDPQRTRGPARDFPALFWEIMQTTHDAAHPFYEHLEYDEQMASWITSAAIINRLPFELMHRLCLDGTWNQTVERTKSAAIAIVGEDYRERAWFAAKIHAMNAFAWHRNTVFPSATVGAAA
jgi:hypothetical protein